MIAGEIKILVERELINYQKEASVTIPDTFTSDYMIDNAVYGLCGETGELVDLLKKVKFQGHKLDKEKAILELGDILWYVSLMATGLGVTLSEVATKNIEKLRKRYGEKFEAIKSIERKE